MATNPSSLLNKRLSLISKLNIRYEGILYSVDSAAQAVALANEDRETDKFVPPSQDVYEFIIFRGSDIQDLIVPNERPSPVPTPQRPQYDPAIMASGAPGMSNQSPFMGYPSSTSSFGLGLPSPTQSFPYGSSPYPNWGGNYFGQWGPNPSGSNTAPPAGGAPQRPPATLSPGLEPPNLVRQPPTQPTPPVQPVQPVELELAQQTQAVQPQQAQKQKQLPTHAQVQTPAPESSFPSDIFDALEPPKRANKEQNQGRLQQKQTGSRSNEGRQDKSFTRKPNDGANRGRNTQQQWKERTPTDTSVADTPATTTTATPSGEDKTVQSRRGGSRGGFSGRGGNKTRTTTRTTNGTKSNTSTRRTGGRGERTAAIPTDLFDIEGATAAFDKESIYQNITESRKPDDEEEEEDDGAYDGSGFFDTLSCEALEKSSRPTKEDWAEQRKLDTETFGSDAGRAHYNNRRGRGGRGRGRGGRGGRSNPADNGENKQERPAQGNRGRGKAKPRPVQQKDEGSSTPVASETQPQGGETEQ